MPISNFIPFSSSLIVFLARDGQKRAVFFMYKEHELIFSGLKLRDFHHEIDGFRFKGD